MRFSFSALSAAACCLPLAPLAALAAEPAAEQTIRLDVVGGGVLAALCGAAITYLQQRRSSARQPPLGEDVARRYATKDDLLNCRANCRKDVEEMRASIAENDKKAEDRARGTHARIDAIYRESQKTTKSLGMLIGIMIGKGVAPASAAAQLGQEE